MKIVADRYLPGITAAFDDAVEVVASEPGSIQNAVLYDCDALLVRTVTRIDESLLKGTPVRFVGTATSGHDHVDTNYLAERGIGFAAAPGSNARPVAEYVLSALAVLCEQDGRGITDHTVGIIGCGHVGSQLAKLLSCLGVETLLNDPPLVDEGDPRDFRELDEVLEADVVTLHVPFVTGGDHPTADLLNAGRLMRMQRGACLINTARGGVVDEAALRDAMATRELRVVLDVWRHEPAVDTGLAAAVTLGTPHIAGYSLDAKLRATAMVCRAACDYFGLHPGTPRHGNSAGEPQTLPLTGSDFAEQARLAILNSYDIRGDAGALRRMLRLPAQEQPAYFSALRQDYRLRREFSSLTLELGGSAGSLATQFRRLGFRVSSA